MNELMQGLQSIQKDIEEFSPKEDIPADRFHAVMTVSFSSCANHLVLARVLMT